MNFGLWHYCPNSLGAELWRGMENHSVCGSGWTWQLPHACTTLEEEGKKQLPKTANYPASLKKLPQHFYPSCLPLAPWPLPCVSILELGLLFTRLPCPYYLPSPPLLPTTFPWLCVVVVLAAFPACLTPFITFLLYTTPSPHSFFLPLPPSDISCPWSDLSGKTGMA